MLHVMTGRMRTTAAVLGGAAVVATGAYALGAQAGDGNAEAAKARSQTAGYGYGPGPARGGPGHGDHLEDLASRLGVSEAKLRTALEELRGEKSREDHEAEHAAALAKALGIDEQKVTDALTKLRQAHEDEHEERFSAFVAAVAKELGVSEAKVRAAFEDARPGPGDRRGGPRPHHGRGPAALGSVAGELGVTRARLLRALRAARPDDPPRRDRGDRGADLAQALGVSEERLEQAFEQLHEERRDAFARELAAKLGIDAAKVADVLGDVPFGHHGRGGRHR